jgi:hypothetical protein
VSRNEGGTKTPLFALNCGSIYMLTWIFVQSMWLQKEIFNCEKRNKRRFELEHWNCMLNKFVLTVDGKNHWKYQIGAINDYYKQVHDFVVVETHATILSLGIVLAYVIVLNSPLPTKWSNQNQWLSC